MTNANVDLEALLEERGALLDGHFRLSSGRHSDRFVQKFRILEDPELVEPLARAIADEFRVKRPTVVVSAAIGGIILGYEVARHLGTKAIFIEKENGMPVLRRNFALSASDRVLIVEDVVTTGLSVREVMALVSRSGASIVGVGIAVLRASTPLSTGSSESDAIPFYALLHLPMQSYDPSDCPQCRAAEPVTEPGSRRS
jgi:orotate phosphoribosyltransferase